MTGTSFSEPFIRRPVGTTLLAVGLLLVGIVAYRQLPVSALPQVDYPTIQVTTFYPGAGPEVMASSVTAPMERTFGQLPGLSQMTCLARLPPCCASSARRAAISSRTAAWVSLSAVSRRSRSVLIAPDRSGAWSTW